MSNAFGKFDLTGKTALITGGAGLLGMQHARALLAIGATVVLTDIDLTALATARRLIIQETGLDKIFTNTMDVSQMQSVSAVFEKLTNNGIHIDILINNAAIDPKVTSDQGICESSRLENFSVKQWDLQIAVGLTGAFLCSRIFGSSMALGGRGGVILNIASDLSVFAPDQRLYRKAGLEDNMQPVKPVTYSVIKTGLIGLTRYLATYWADAGVRCNALSPGGIYNNQGEEFSKRLSSLIPMGRMAEKEEYRSAVQFLCSDASSYMNGQNIVMDGGRSAW